MAIPKTWGRADGKRKRKGSGRLIAEMPISTIVALSTRLGCIDDNVVLSHRFLGRGTLKGDNAAFILDHEWTIVILHESVPLNEVSRRYPRISSPQLILTAYTNMASGESPRPKDSARHTAEDRERRRQRKEREGETEEDRERRRRRRSAHAGDTEEDGEKRRRRRSEHARDTEEDGERRRRRSAHAGDTEEDGERRRRRRSEHTRDTEEDGDRRRKRSENQQRRSRGTTPSSGSSQALSAASLAKLALLNEQKSVEPEVRPQKPRRKPDREFGEARIDVEERTYIEEQKMHKKKRRRRDVSGALLEEGNSKTLKGLRGGDIDEVIYEKYEKFDEDAGMSKKKKKLCKSMSLLRGHHC
jgi:hypothetical protein